MATLYFNRKLTSQFQVLDTLDVGIVLEGWKAKSVKEQMGQFQDAFVQARDTSLQLKGAIIPAWKTAPSQPLLAQRRDRVLLAHGREAAKLAVQAKQPGHTLMVQEVYTDSRGLIKLKIALVRGKKQFERKQDVKERDLKREESRRAKGLNF